VIGAESEDPELAKRGRHLLKTIGVPRFMGGGYSQVPVVDPVANQITLLTPAQVVGFVGGGSSGHVPQVGGAVPGWFGDPSGNVEDRDSCIKGWTIIGSVLGSAAGAGLGGVAGASVSGGGPWVVGVGIGSGGITGFWAGAQGGQSFGQAVCNNNITFDIAHLREFGWVRIHKAIPVELCNRLVEVLETELRVRSTIRLGGTIMVGNCAISCRSGGIRRSGTFGSTLICTASGRRSTGQNGCSCLWIPVASHRPGSPAMPSLTASIGITILGIPRSECFKAFWR
jgi:hypothetical protein